MNKEIIFIGDKFYSESSTMMSSIYHADFTRCDWGFVQSYLRDGYNVNIRPATQDEMSYFEDMLTKYKEKFNHA